MVQRGRRTTRVSGDERQEAILVAAESLLTAKPLDEISIEELATGAGISRPTFYFYFSSKDDVLLALLDRVIGEVERRVGALPRDFAAAPADAWRESIGVFVEVFSAHRAVSAAAVAARLRNPEVHALWSKAMASWVDYSTEVIVAERARGAAPTGPLHLDARELAIALNLMNERALTAAFNGDSPAIDPGGILDVLAAVWLRAIYVTDTPS
jgi:AcrR family transcriptional regulator